MIKSLMERFRQGHRTIDYVEGKIPALPDRFRGLPVIDGSKCEEGCRDCAEACPTDAISLEGGGVELDLGRCLFCSECQNACPEGAIAYSTEHRMAARSRADLRRKDGAEIPLAAALDKKLQKLFGRSLKLRQVSAGGCNGCESDVNVLGTVVFDLGRFGVQYVASPRHADGLLITGPVTENMRLALEKTYAAVPEPKIVIAVGACAIGGGPFLYQAEQHNGADSVVPVDLYIPGCPPHPLTILDGMLRLLGRIESGDRNPARRPNKPG